MSFKVGPYRVELQHVLCAVGLSGALVSGGCLYLQHVQVRGQQVRVDKLNARLKEMQEVGMQEPMLEAHPSWVTSLPSKLDAQIPVSLIRAGAESEGVQLRGLHLVELAPSAKALGRLVVDVEAYGSYAGSKGLLIELSAREPQKLLLQDLALRRRGGTDSLEFHAQLIWLSQPSRASVASPP